MTIGLILEDVRRRQLPIIEEVEIVGFTTINSFVCAIVARYDGTVEAVDIKRLKGPKYEPKRISELTGQPISVERTNEGYEPVVERAGASSERVGSTDGSAGPSGDGQVSSGLPSEAEGLRGQEENPGGSVPPVRGSGSKGNKRSSNKRKE